MVCLHILGLFIVIVLSVALPAIGHKRKHGRAVPPKPRFVGMFSEDHDRDGIAARLKHWSPKDKQNAWELSGLYEGDIMINPEGALRNGLLNANTRWPGGVVPYHIDEIFTRDQRSVIEDALEEYHNKTCIRFRPYEDGDEAYVTITGSYPGCMSMVGRYSQGQIVNLQPEGCVHHGIVIHEMMHALGFHHQHGASDRDDWVSIHWENIKEGLEYAFDKYNDNTVTDFGIGYDYESVMHYSDHAFTKNDEPTITPKEEGVEIGQREGFSEKDIAKVEAMYEEECKGREPVRRRCSYH